MMRKAVTLAALLTLATGVSFADKPPAGSDPSPPEVAAARQAVARAVAAVVKDLGSDEDHKRQAAHAALQKLSESVMDEVVARADLRDAEQTVRVGKLFESVAASARQGGLMISLSPKARKLVGEVAQEKPKAFSRFFHARPTVRAEAITRLAASEKAGAEYVASWALRNGGWQVRLAAAQAAGALEVTSGKINDALLQRLGRLGGARSDLEGLRVAARMGEMLTDLLDQISSAEQTAIVESLVRLKDKRILSILISSLLGRSGGLMGDMDIFEDHDTSISDMIVQFNDKRTIPTLMDCLDAAGSDSSVMTINNVTVKRCDRIMVVIIRQTKQSLRRYGLETGGDLEFFGEGTYGFRKEATRKAARKKLQAWWAEHKKQYAGVKKIPLDSASDDPAEEEGP